MEAYASGMTSNRPDLDDLALLVLVAETGSIGRAAARRGAAQPSVSRRMAALERSLGVHVLQRTPRGSSLTPAGRALVDWAIVLLSAAEDFSRSVSTLRAGAGGVGGAGSVLAGVSMTLAEHRAPAWIAQLRRTSGAPVPTVSFTVANSTEVSASVENGDLEIGFMESPTVRVALRTSTFGVDRLTVAVAPEHPWARRAPDLDEFATTPLLVREVGSGTRETLEQALHECGLHLRPTLEMASNTALRAAAVAGLGPVVLSELAVTAEVSEGRLVPVAIPGLDLGRPFTAAWRRRGGLSPGARALLSAVRRAEEGRRGASVGTPSGP